MTRGSACSTCVKTWNASGNALLDSWYCRVKLHAFMLQIVAYIHLQISRPGLIIMRTCGAITAWVLVNLKRLSSIVHSVCAPSDRTAGWVACCDQGAVDISCTCLEAKWTACDSPGTAIQAHLLAVAMRHCQDRICIYGCIKISKLLNATKHERWSYAISRQ